MTLLNQVSRGKPGAVAVIQRHAALFEAGNDAVDDHHTGHLLHQMNEFGIGDHFRVNHQGGTAVTNQLFNGLALFEFIMIAVADQ